MATIQLQWLDARRKTRDLTLLLSCSVHPMGGTAYLSLESPDEPFLHGTKFTAMPPTKRFRDMEQLSGGEKVMPGRCLPFVSLAWPLPVC